MCTLFLGGDRRHRRRGWFSDNDSIAKECNAVVTKPWTRWKQIVNTNLEIINNLFTKYGLTVLTECGIIGMVGESTIFAYTV